MLPMPDRHSIRQEASGADLQPSGQELPAGAKEPATGSQPLDARTVQRLRFALTLSLAVAAGLAYLLSRSFRAEVNHAAVLLGRGDVATIRDYLLSFGVWAPIVSALLMILQALVAPLPAFLITFANGLAFGPFWGAVLTFTSATLAAVLSFWLARGLGRGPVEALAGKAGLEFADHWFARWGTLAILIARLVPIISFDIISYAAGLTGMSFVGFLVATMLGILPATILYSYLGARAPEYVGVLFWAFGIVIGVAVVIAILRRWKRTAPNP